MVNVDSDHDRIIHNDLEGAVYVIVVVDVNDDDNINVDWIVLLVMIMMKSLLSSVTITTAMHCVQYSSNK